MWLDDDGLTRCKVKGSPKLLQFILRGTWMSIQNFMASQPILVQSGPKWWTANVATKNAQKAQSEITEVEYLTRQSSFRGCVVRPVTHSWDQFETNKRNYKTVSLFLAIFVKALGQDRCILQSPSVSEVRCHQWVCKTFCLMDGKCTRVCNSKCVFCLKLKVQNKIGLPWS